MNRRAFITLSALALTLSACTTPADPPPKTPEPDPPPAGATMTAIAAGANFSIALQSDGTVWAWGQNNRGQLGVGWPRPGEADDLYPAPVSVELDDIVSVAAAGYAAFALDSSGTVWAWGDNQQFQLATGDNQSRGVPEPVAGLPPIDSIWPASDHVHAVDTDGDVWVWGAGGWHFGLPTADSRPTPSLVPEFSTMETLGLTYYSSSANHVLALDADGQLYGWDENRYGQLAQDPSTLVVQEPEAIVISGIDSFRTAAAGGAVSIGVTADGDVYTWGRNAFGELGDGSALGTVRHQPGLVAGVSDVIAVAAGPHRGDSHGAHVLVLTTSGKVHAWGYSSHGQVGNGSTADQVNGVRITRAPEVLRHFSAHFEPIGGSLLRG